MTIVAPIVRRSQGTELSNLKRPHRGASRLNAAAGGGASDAGSDGGGSGTRLIRDQSQSLATFRTPLKTDA